MRAKMKTQEVVREMSIPTPERMRLAGDNYVIGSDPHRRVVTILDPFTAAFHRGQFTQKQYDAGSKFRIHYERGGIHGVLSSVSFDGCFGGKVDFSHLAKTEDQLHHRRQFFLAEKLLGMDTAALMRRVCCEGWTLEKAGNSLHWKCRKQATAAATERLRHALDQLADLWGV
jgi:hypothetical protein